jgi:hypothetical protein
MQGMQCALNWSGIFPFLSSGQTVRWAVAAVKGTVGICAVYAERMQDIQDKSSIQQDDLSARRLDLSFKKKLMKCYIWNIAFYGAETWTLGKTYQKYLKRFDMRWGRRIEVSWNDRVRSDEVLRRFEEKNNTLRTVQ